jgi:hypothetical protein
VGQEDFQVDRDGVEGAVLVGDLLAAGEAGADVG